MDNKSLKKQVFFLKISLLWQVIDRIAIDLFLLGGWVIYEIDGFALRIC